jgi:hypothetical protein
LAAVGGADAANSAAAVPDWSGTVRTEVRRSRSVFAMTLAVSMVEALIFLST